MGHFGEIRLADPVFSAVVLPTWKPEFSATERGQQMNGWPLIVMCYCNCHTASARLCALTEISPESYSVQSVNWCPRHTPSTAFRHLPPNSARFSYAIEGALFISAQQSTDAVSALWKVRVLIWLQKRPAPKHARKHEAHPPWVKREFRLDSNDFQVLFELT